MMIGSGDDVDRTARNPNRVTQPFNMIGKGEGMSDNTTMTYIKLDEYTRRALLSVVRTVVPETDDKHEVMLSADCRRLWFRERAPFNTDRETRLMSANARISMLEIELRAYKHGCDPLLPTYGELTRENRHLVEVNQKVFDEAAKSRVAVREVENINQHLRNKLDKVREVLR